MALINIFKKDNKETAKTETGSKPAVAAAPRGDKKKAYNVGSVLKQAHVTEKASRLAEAHNQYVFQVTPRANKSEIAKAVESYYKVDVVGVNILTTPGKRHRRAKGISKDSDLRKAIVKIKAGQKIELLPR